MREQLTAILLAGALALVGAIGGSRPIQDEAESPERNPKGAAESDAGDSGAAPEDAASSHSPEAKQQSSPEKSSDPEQQKQPIPSIKLVVGSFDRIERPQRIPTQLDPCPRPPHKLAGAVPHDFPFTSCLSTDQLMTARVRSSSVVRLRGELRPQAPPVV
ncbi:MAG: hypothetical protein J5J06_18415 [Phycisphaerae bacterium]|nr:hypothetical protein [Phycisphaerae bacterium]